MDVAAWSRFFAVLALAANALVVGGVALVAWRGVAWVRQEFGPYALPLAFLIAVTATLGSLYYSEIAGFPPCELCWYQRMAMYPLAVILGVAAVRRDPGVRRYVLPVALPGAVIATDGSSSIAPVSITGESLPPFVPEAAADAAVGQPAPLVRGKDFAGNLVTVPARGRPGIVLFLAHWCPVCQREVPIVSDWHTAGRLPDDVAFVSVSTSVSPSRDNYPPSSWLQREGWPLPVLADDGASAAASAFGLQAFPFWVFVDADGTVVGRFTGVLEAAALDEIVTALQAQQ